MRIAIPVAAEKLNPHFGHCDQLALIDVDDATHSILARNDVTPPPHEPGLLPRWLGEKEVNLVIAGGMGQRAVQLFEDRNIKVLVGAPIEAPETLVKAFIAGSLTTSGNGCDH